MIPALAGQASEVGALGGATPKVVTDSDKNSVELGVRFTSSVGGTVTGIRFYKGSQNTGTHIGSLWRSDGTRLATVTFTRESASGWQTATFAEPVAISTGKTYVASYLAPRGRYSADENYFTKPVNRGVLTIPAGGGVYRYGNGGYPKDNYRNSNYYVDVVFRPSTAAQPQPTPTATPATTPTATATPKPTGTPTPTATPTAIPTAQPTPSPTPTQAPNPGAGASVLNLPRIAWEGGPAYWKKFAKADAAGWDDPSFFPILSWFGNFSSDEEVQYDKSLGINTYSGMWEGTPYSLFKDNGVFWVGDKLNETFTDTSSNWVGHFLDDEVDGRYSIRDGQAHLQKIVDNIGDDGRFKYANYTQMVVGTDLQSAAAKKYVNGYTDVVSIDMYWYTIPYCDQTPYRDVYLTPVGQANCRTASSYGKMMNSLRTQDASDAALQPLWQWIENYSGSPGDDAPAAVIAPGQLKGAVMNSIINEARGIAYFNQSLTGSCQSGNIFRQSQVTKNFCANGQVAAVKEVNSQIHSLASVINTQSYDYSFGQGLDTMLKAAGGSAYIFAMVDGSSKPGGRTFSLPAGVTGTSVEVLNENRTIAVDANRTFVDTFANEYSYHIYRVALG